MHQTGIMRSFLRLLTFVFVFSAFTGIPSNAQSPLGEKKFTRQDTLRGSIGPGRDWWDVTRYDLNIDVNIQKKFLRGYTDISFRVTRSPIDPVMQIDLQHPMEIDSVHLNASGGSKNIPFEREGNVYWLKMPPITGNKPDQQIRVYYKGYPKPALNAPWNGGWVLTRDSLGRPWATVACEGLGASVWYPCKDHQSDKPDKGASLTITAPDTLTAVGNGRLTIKTDNHDGTITWKWEVVNPINAYLIVPYIGKYVNFSDTLNGVRGKLDLSYWVLDYNLAKAKKHFEVVKPMLHCFEGWMGPYPFYEDGYKLVDAPYLGMEHQSAVAYGNKYLNGYLGKDRSGSGWGMDWDFIIVHESAHEWFGNSITAADAADMWIQESFTTYAETLFVQCRHGLKAAGEYVRGQRKNITNRLPLTGPYGVNREGGDIYDKGANFIHTLRQLINNDVLFRDILKGLNRTFYHRSVSAAGIEGYIEKRSGRNLENVFEQYLRTTQIPVLEYKQEGRVIWYRWTGSVAGFNMPVKCRDGRWLRPTEAFKKLILKDAGAEFPGVDPNFYINVRKIG
jgi:aminopeptidase N